MAFIEKLPVIAVLGPTASGKSSLAINIALKFDGEIVNCDSRQIYQEMNIGTAKPTYEEQKLVKHHLFDLIKPSEKFSAGDYLNAARKVIREINQRGKTPVLAGGTGFYYSAISEGLPPTDSDPEISARLHEILETQGLEALKSMLEELDSEALDLIDVNNSRRVLRALEVVMITQKPFSQNKPVSPLPEAEFFPIVVSRPRKVLHQRIEERVRQMIEQGLERETKALLQKYGPKAPGLNSIGYSEWFDFFSNEKSIEQVIEEIIINSRQYAKRQETWFRKRPGTQMHNLEDAQTSESIFSLVNDFLKKF